MSGKATSIAENNLSAFRPSSVSVVDNMAAAGEEYDLCCREVSTVLVFGEIF